MLTTSEKYSELQVESLAYSYFQSKGISTFHEACKYVAGLPYARNTNKADVLCVLIEGKGTCSTKHVLLKNLAEDLGLNRVKLFIGVFRMNKSVFPILAPILEESGLSFIPEAHTYLRVEEAIYDYTMPENKTIDFARELLAEQEMRASELNNLKIPYHKKFLEHWIQKENIPYALDEIWDIRERCIQRLSEAP